MTDDTAPAGPAAPPTGDNGPADQASMLGLARTLVGELPGLMSDRVHLFALELRRSGLALARIVAWATAAAVLLTTAWLALWVGLGTGAIRAGWSWGWVVAGIIGINLVAALVAVRQALALAPLLALPATLRRLTFAPSAQPSHAEAHEQAHEETTAPVHAVPPGEPLQAGRTLH